ncbi:hypothetical protein COX27_01175 [Candidatus Kuenenbacteria bacterium CG23_combo_of_CG06-09_8_20_14_all_36_9]|nr:MAG: hypothetical protein COX27_01175 [Candidatus Kuenenbacteria bacterium CG23_combo_of_CG06-09_8_20_14_all_36_9]
MENVNWGWVLFFLIVLIFGMILLTLRRDAKGEELLSVSNTDIFSANCSPAVNAKGFFKAEVEVEFYHPVYANIVLVKAGTDSEVFRTAAEPEPQKNLLQICGGWQLEESVRYDLLLIYQSTGERVHKLTLATDIYWLPKNLVAKK